MKRKNYFKTFSVFFMLMLLSIGCQPESGSESEPAKKTFTIIFNPNGGTGEMNPQTAEDSAEITLAMNAFTRDGYEFTGWNTAAAGRMPAATNSSSPRTRCFTPSGRKLKRRRIPTPEAPKFPTQ